MGLYVTGQIPQDFPPWETVFAVRHCGETTEIYLTAPKPPEPRKV
jgi:hypothetical protein